MKMRTIVASISAGILLAGCSDDPPSLEDRLVSLCRTTVEDHADESLSLGATITDLKFSDMSATLWDGSRPTERWVVKGHLSITKQPPPSVEPGAWDEEGTTPATFDDPGPIKCRMGHRKSDDKLVVFEFMHYHPTSGGGVGRQLTFEDGSNGGTSDWG